MLSALIALIAGLQAPAAPVQIAPPNAAMKFAADGQTQAVDCQNGDLTILGSKNALTLTRCMRVVVAGDHNRIKATLVQGSIFDITGDGNNVKWVSTQDWTAIVRDTGHGNEALALGRD